MNFSSLSNIVPLKLKAVLINLHYEWDMLRIITGQRFWILQQHSTAHYNKRFDKNTPIITIHSNCITSEEDILSTHALLRLLYSSITAPISYKMLVTKQNHELALCCSGIIANIGQLYVKLQQRMQGNDILSSQLVC